MTIVVALLTAAIAAGATRFAMARLIPTAPLRRANYRGVPVATGLGIAVFAGFVVACGVLALFAEIDDGWIAPGVWILPLAAGGVFGMLGLFDDAASALAPGTDKGLKGHTQALTGGRLTSGALKMLAGSAAGFVLAAPATDGFAFAVAGGAIIALSAHVLNAFDLRPGRAAKLFVAGMVPLAVVAGPLRAVVCAAIGAAIAALPDDLRERAMLGDAGAGALGAIAGSSALLVSTRMTMLITLGVLAVLTIVAEGPTISRMIDTVPFLRAADRWGRVPEPTRYPQQQASIPSGDDAHS